jgi:MFS family permease
VWGAAVATYGVAVLHRSSLGVAGVEAVERFGVGAAVLSTFVVVQLAVYAGMQVPLGVLLDRYGPRVLIAGGAALMAVGQVVLGLVDELPGAYVARVLIGAGDAATFISVIRLVPAWFPAGRVPLLTQLTALIGTLGQLAAALPLVALLHVAGWTSAFVGLGGVGGLAAITSFAVVRDRPPGASGVRSGLGGWHDLGAAARTPGTWLGFWTHAVGQFPVTVFLLLWGYPFLTSAQGLSPTQAGGLMSLSVVAALLTGPVIGVLTGRHPFRRSWMVLTIAVATAVVWTAVLLQPGRSPGWLLAVLVVVLGVGGPGATIGFDYARTSNPAERMGTATGLVNVGGFATAVVTILAVGVVLDVVGADDPLSLPAFRAAFAVMAVPWTIAVVGVLVTRRRTRRLMLADGVVVPRVREVLVRRRDARTGGAADEPR